MAMSRFRDFCPTLAMTAVFCYLSLPALADEINWQTCEIEGVASEGASVDLLKSAQNEHVFQLNMASSMAVENISVFFSGQDPKFGSFLEYEIGRDSSGNTNGKTGKVRYRYCYNYNKSRDRFDNENSLLISDNPFFSADPSKDVSFALRLFGALSSNPCDGGSVQLESLGLNEPHTVP